MTCPSKSDPAAASSRPKEGVEIARPGPRRKGTGGSLCRTMIACIRGRVRGLGENCGQLDGCRIGTDAEHCKKHPPGGAIANPEARPLDPACWTGQFQKRAGSRPPPTPLSLNHTANLAGQGCGRIQAFSSAMHPECRFGGAGAPGDDVMDPYRRAFVVVPDIPQRRPTRLRCGARSK